MLKHFIALAILIILSAIVPGVGTIAGLVIWILIAHKS